MKRNPTTFRIFSPDELGSNKLDAVFDVTNRQFQWDPETAHRGGRVVEMLSEHSECYFSASWPLFIFS